MSESKVRQHKVLSHPILACFILWIYGYVFYQFFDGVGYVISGKNMAVTSLFGALGGVLLLVIHRLWFRGEFKGAFSLSGLKNRPAIIAAAVYIIWPIIAVIINVASGAKLVMPTALSISASLMAAFAEEAIYRVLMISVMMRFYKDKDNFLPALIIPGICFALVHVPNAFMGASVSSTCLQVFDCIISAIFIWGVIYIRTGNITLCMLIHFLNDVIGMLSESSSKGVMTATIGWDTILFNCIPWAMRIAIGIWLLKGHKDDIKKTWNTIWSK